MGHWPQYHSLSPLLPFPPPCFTPPSTEWGKPQSKAPEAVQSVRLGTANLICTPTIHPFSSYPPLGIRTPKSETVSSSLTLPPGEMPHSSPAQTQVRWQFPDFYLFYFFYTSTITTYLRVCDIKLLFIPFLVHQQDVSVAVSPDPLATCLLITTPPPKAPYLVCHHPSSRMKTTTTTPIHPLRRHTQHTLPAPTVSLLRLGVEE